MKSIVVAGSINMDLVIPLDRMPRPGETVVGRDIRYVPGGKGSNQAIAARRLGNGPVAMISKLGQDSFGDELIRFLATQDLVLDGVTRCPGPSGTAVITIDSTSENFIVVVSGANFQVSTSDIDAMAGVIGEVGVAVSQLEIPIPVIEHFLGIAKEKAVITILNATPARQLTPSILSAVDYLVVNETELAYFAGKQKVREDVASVVADARKLQAQGPRNVVVTLGSKGSVTVAGPEVIEIEGVKVEAVDPTGAGDCFVGGLAAQLNAGAELRQALDFANRAAALTVQRVGASSSIPYASELQALGDER
ncbi:MAG: ribokinase [Dehalococcoidia bacterium]